MGKERSPVLHQARGTCGEMYISTILYGTGREINVTFIPSFVRSLLEYPGTPPRTRTVFGAGDTEMNKNDF